MWFKFKLFIKNLFAKSKTYEQYIHKCYSHDSQYQVKPKYFTNGKLGKGKFAIRYNVYELGICDACSKHYRNKVSTNITSSRLFNKYGIRNKN